MFTRRPAGTGPGRRDTLVALLLPLAGMALAGRASAQSRAKSFPTGPITLLVGDTTGSHIDAAARAIGPALGKVLRRSVTVENRAGAGGLTAQTAGAKARPDGYTLLLAGTTGLVLAPRLVAQPPYALEDFAGIGLVSETPLVVEVPADSRFQSFAEMVAEAKARPGAVRIGHAGNGTTGHLAILRLQQRLEVSFAAVPDTSPASDLGNMPGGTFDAIAVEIPTSIARRGAGGLKPLAVTSLKRAPSLPETPTLNEIGLKGFEIVAGTGLLAPARTPPSTLEILSGALQKAIDDPDVEAKLKRRGSEPRALSPQAYEALLKREDAVAAQLIKDGLLKAE